MAKVYTCIGSCHAGVSLEQYEKGVKKCGAKNCDLRGHDFQALEQCPDCIVASLKKNKLHTCPQCRPL